MMLWVFGAIIALFILLGIVLMRGHGANLIAGYNTMPKEQKERYDAPAMCRFMGKIMFAMAACLFVMALAEPLQLTVLFYIGLGLFFAVILFTLIYANTGNRFQKK